MKFWDLLNIERAIDVKKTELEEIKKELQLLQKEVEEFKLMIDINNKYYSLDELINIENIYLVKEKHSGINYFAKRIEYDTLKYKFVDIYTNESIVYLNVLDLCNVINGYDKYYYCQPIIDAFPETRVYLDGRVPKILIQKLYYQVNGIDNKVLKKGAMKD